MSNYNYEIEKLLAQYDDKPDKDVERTCGNCCAYDHVIFGCNRDDEGEDIIEENTQGCWYHRTHKEDERLKLLLKQRQDEADRLRLEEQRKNGTGDCAGCPFRNVNKELYDFANFFETFAEQCYCRILGEAGQKIYDEAVRICKKARGEE